MLVSKRYYKSVTDYGILNTGATFAYYDNETKVIDYYIKPDINNIGINLFTGEQKRFAGVARVIPFDAIIEIPEITI